MARTKKYQLHYKREVQPDPIYKSRIIPMLQQRLIRHGKKKLASRILQNSLQNIQNQTQLDPLFVLEKALRNTTPSVEIQTRRIGGAVYPLPVELGFERGMLKALQWLFKAAKKRSGPTLAVNLANEFIDASKKAGTAFHKKEEVHKIAEANGRVK
uniref:Small ribosomal subunit protein uS7c n=1 Tax=Rhipilia penicilloides TaxID=1979422 RepID=A0A2P0QIZ6_9CHLO|nr:ribosomal protein S7 [Rhipilia penicilloides]ARO74289.1 ribosomal protein S7 [Rhipilia penicilloides]